MVRTFLQEVLFSFSRQSCQQLIIFFSVSCLQRDDIKIFDFGLAKELLEKLKTHNGTYKLTPLTGSIRYMAPEVANSMPYNKSCDTYSFSLLLWQMLVMEEPYKLFTLRGFQEKIYNGPCKRPPIPRTMKEELKLCLKKGWCHSLHERSTMDQTMQFLRKEIVQARDGDELGLSHRRRRSTFIFKMRSSMFRSLNGADA